MHSYFSTNNPHFQSHFSTPKLYFYFSFFIHRQDEYFPNYRTPTNLFNPRFCCNLFVHFSHSFYPSGFSIVLSLAHKLCTFVGFALLLPNQAPFSPASSLKIESLGQGNPPSAGSWVSPKQIHFVGTLPCEQAGQAPRFELICLLFVVLTFCLYYYFITLLITINITLFWFVGRDFICILGFVSVTYIASSSLFFHFLSLFLIFFSKTPGFQNE